MPKGTIYTIISTFARTLVQIVKIMYNKAVQFGSKPRPPHVDKERAQLSPEQHQEVAHQDIVNQDLNSGSGDYRRESQEGTNRDDSSHLPRDNNKQFDQIVDPQEELLTSATDTTSFAARKSGLHHSYPQYSSGSLTAHHMADQQDPSHIANEDAENRKLADPDHSWDPDNDALMSAIDPSLYT
jgi:hypothetical protein